MDRWTTPGVEDTFVGGGLTFWDPPGVTGGQHYDTRSGDVALIDRYVSVMLYLLLTLTAIEPFGTKRIPLPKEPGGLW